MRSHAEDEEVTRLMRSFDTAWGESTTSDDVDRRLLARTECDWIRRELQVLKVDIEKLRPDYRESQDRRRREADIYRGRAKD
jgi:hypothetical protein